MLEHLRKISKSIDELLSKDPFPNAVRPAYLQSAVRDYPLNGGKRLRPALLIWSCGMLGGSEGAALYPAAAAEVYHNWTLVHDDIIDQDLTRRNRPTCHVKLSGESSSRFMLPETEAERTGRDFAILTGDLQQGWANDLLLRSAEHGVSAKTALALGRLLQRRANSELISGEALDVEFSLRKLESITPDEVRDMLYLKTGALLRFCTEAGAMIALDTDDPETPEVKKLGEFAVAAGVAFQLRDDYLGIFGDYQSLGKSLGGDLREGKATILLLAALRMAVPADRNRLFRMLGHRQYTPGDLEIVRTIMRDSGAAGSIEAEAEQLAERARNLLAEFPNNEYRSYLHELVNYLIYRER